MRPVAPRLQGVDERMAGMDDEDLKPLTVGECRSNEGEPVIITRWRFSEEDKQRIAAGEDLFLYLFAPLLPQLQISVGSMYHEHDDT